MPTSRINLAGGQVSYPENHEGEQTWLINWLIDPTQQNRTRPAVVNTVFDPTNNRNTTGTNTGNIGMVIWKNPVDSYEWLVYVRADRQIFAKNLTTLAKVSLSTAGSPTTLLEGTARAVFTDDSLRLIIAGGGALQTWDGNVLHQSARLAAYVSGSNQPPQGATHVAKLANYVVANNQYPGYLNRFIWSDIGDGNDASWPPLNFNTADAKADPVLGLYANLRELYIFGTDTLQVYGVSGDSALPFQAISTVDIGTIAPYSPISLGTEFAFLDNLRRFVTTDGRGYTVISDAISKDLGDMQTLTDCFGFRCKIGWWDLLVWVFQTEGTAWWYERNTKQWGQWRNWNDGFIAPRLGAYAFSPTQNLHYIGDTQYENIFTLDMDSYLDVGNDGTTSFPVVAERITPRNDYSTAKRKKCNSVTLFLKRGSDEEVFLELSKRDDDGPWSTPKLIDLGDEADTKSWKNWYPGGIFRRRQYRIRYSGADESVISAIEEDWSVMTS